MNSMILLALMLKLVIKPLSLYNNNDSMDWYVIYSRSLCENKYKRKERIHIGFKIKNNPAGRSGRNRQEPDRH